MSLKKKAKYGIIGAIVFGFYFFFVHPLIENNYGEKSLVKGIVLKSEWYSSSVGFSTKGAKGYFKQKVEYSFSFNDKKYSRQFDNGPDIGVLSKGDSVLIEFKDNYNKDSKIVGKVKTGRKKIKTVKGSAH